MKETVKINVETLKKQVEDGMKKDALAKHYGLPMNQMTKALKDAGLKIRKFHKPAFELVDSTEEVVEETITDSVAPVATEEIANVDETPGDDTATTVEETPADEPAPVVEAENVWKH